MDNFRKCIMCFIQGGEKQQCILCGIIRMWITSKINYSVFHAWETGVLAHFVRNRLIVDNSEKEYNMLHTWKKSIFMSFMQNIENVDNFKNIFSCVLYMGE